MKQSSQSNNGWNNWLLISAVVALTIAPLIFVRGEYGGADGEAEEVITEVKPEYKPWFTPIFEPPSGEIETLLFCAQAGLGAGLIGYSIGLYRGRSERKKREE
ncbi:MAG: energy-coupling factor ABC transporter substrate-binding protein [Rivularia sp. (in: Bacteria)]|nr:energy-coupling factor ABC transporter substrate-binding protein [Rivularia sp. MS3]